MELRIWSVSYLDSAHHSKSVQLMVQGTGFFLQKRPVKLHWTTLLTHFYSKRRVMPHHVDFAAKRDLRVDAYRSRFVWQNIDDVVFTCGEFFKMV